MHGTYVARTASGLYEQADAGYGEIQFALGDRRASTRMVTDEGALETIFDLAGLKPDEENEVLYTGHPLQTQPGGAAPIFYGVWPALVAITGFTVTRRRT